MGLFLTGQGVQSAAQDLLVVSRESGNSGNIVFRGSAGFSFPYPLLRSCKQK